MEDGLVPLLLVCGLEETKEGPNEGAGGGGSHRPTMASALHGVPMWQPHPPFLGCGVVARPPCGELLLVAKPTRTIFSPRPQQMSSLASFGLPLKVDSGAQGLTGQSYPVTPAGTQVQQHDFSGVRLIHKAGAKVHPTSGELQGWN